MHHVGTISSTMLTAGCLLLPRANSQHESDCTEHFKRKNV